MSCVIPERLIKNYYRTACASLTANVNGGKFVGVERNIIIMLTS